MKPGLLNLWIIFIPAYALIWSVMIFVNRKRGNPIEDTELMTKNKKEQFLFGFIPQILLTAATVFVPINFGSNLYLGFIVFTTGFAIDIISILSFSTTGLELNTKGIYKYSRNPMYAGGFVMILGINLIGFAMSAAGIILLLISALWVVCTHNIVIKEEQFLLKKYSDVYTEYKHQTPRYFGFINK